jgi:replication initiation and membrane attachment protein DnaB
VERAMNSSEDDLGKYLDKIRSKTMKKYVKTLKEDLNNQQSLTLLQKLGTMFTMGKKSNDLVVQKKSHPEIKEKEESNDKSKKGPISLSKLKLAELPSAFKQSESGLFKFSILIYIYF